MTKKHSIKKALLTSIMSLILCFAMLTGTTFAWFTDQETSANNKIIAGNLDIELYYQAEGQSDWTNVTESTNIFKENSLWEPGHTEVVKLKIVNEGSLALKYTLGVNVAGENGSVNVNDNAFKLSDFIKYAIIDGAQTYTRDAAVSAAEANNATALNIAYNSDVTALEPKNDTDSDEKIVTMVVYMPTTVGNDANAKTGAAVPTINLGIELVATQQTAEEDAFGPDYDKNAVSSGFASGAAPAPGTESTYIVMDNVQKNVLGVFSVSHESIEDATKTVDITITPIAADSNVTVTDLQLIKTFDIKVSNVKPGNTEPIAVELFVGKDLSGVKLYHNTEEIIGAAYDATTGFVSFETTSFSPFSVVYNKYNLPAVGTSAEDLTWEEISQIGAVGLADEYFDLGDTKTFTLSDGTEIVMEIVAFGKDIQADGTVAPITWLSKNVVTTYVMNDMKTADGYGVSTGGWGASELRAWLQSDYYETLPQELKDVIITVSKKSLLNKGEWSSNNKVKDATTEDTLWIPSIAEINPNDVSKENTGTNYYGYFTKDSLFQAYARPTLNGENLTWWLRSAATSNVFGKFHVAASAFNQGMTGGDAFSHATQGIVIGFCT